MPSPRNQKTTSAFFTGSIDTQCECLTMNDQGTALDKWDTLGRERDQHGDDDLKQLVLKLPLTAKELP